MRWSFRLHSHHLSEPPLVQSEGQPAHGPYKGPLSPLGQAVPVTDLPLGGSTDPGNVLGCTAVFPVPSARALKPPHPLGDIPG